MMMAGMSGWMYGSTIASCSPVAASAAGVLAAVCCMLALTCSSTCCAGEGTRAQLPHSNACTVCEHWSCYRYGFNVDALWLGGWAAAAACTCLEAGPECVDPKAGRRRRRAQRSLHGAELLLAKSSFHVILDLVPRLTKHTSLALHHASRRTVQQGLVQQHPPASPMSRPA